MGCRGNLASHRPGARQNRLAPREGSARGLVDILLRKLLRSSLLWPSVVFEVGQKGHESLVTFHQ